jgi:outer membrane protein OmpA-like peptidoglycan-associated protein
MRIGLIFLAVLWTAPALAQQPPVFTIYFDFDSARPSRVAREIARRAVDVAKQRQAEGQFDHVKVIGYADTSGALDRAQALSQQRAEAVKRLLVGQGLSATTVRTEGRGKQELAVETADQVREPRNRRARITIYGPGE